MDWMRGAAGDSNFPGGDRRVSRRTSRPANERREGSVVRIPHHEPIDGDLDMPRIRERDIHAIGSTAGNCD